MTRLLDIPLGALLATALVCAPLGAKAAGPVRIATSDRTLWPYRVDSTQAFDLASRAEILAFANVWAANDTQRDANAWAAWLSIEAANPVSIERWQGQNRTLWIENFEKASLSCQAGTDLFCPAAHLHTWAEIVAFARRHWASLPEPLRPWAAEQQRFYEAYLYEQLRLAALFPNITSEILAYDDSEILGTGYPDRSFLLTFDDGPTAVSGDTDQLIALLRQRHVSALFFLLGDRLKLRLDASTPATLKVLYEGMCVASHGGTHRLHPKTENWRQSIDSTNAALSTILPSGQTSVKYFRPPYGQRTREISRYIVSLHQRDMLWNIDSQDWNSGITPEQITGRTVSLMLLWRRGILLFHDVHPGAKKALPAILGATEKSGIRWMSCR